MWHADLVDIRHKTASDACLMFVWRLSAYSTFRLHIILIVILWLSNSILCSFREVIQLYFPSRNADPKNLSFQTASMRDAVRQLLSRKSNPTFQDKNTNYSRPGAYIPPIDSSLPSKRDSRINEDMPGLSPSAKSVGRVRLRLEKRGKDANTEF